MLPEDWRVAKAIPYPSPPLASEAFVLRPLRADDYPMAWEIREHAETAEWVTALPAPDGESLVRLLESSR
jgi:hypothetical protein